MSIHVNVQDGTGAGRRRARPAKTWKCCGHLLASYSCPSCGRRRRDAETSVKSARCGEDS